LAFGAGVLRGRKTANNIDDWAIESGQIHIEGLIKTSVSLKNVYE
jgi:hypothetical protein